MRVRFDADNALRLVRAHDVVVDCSDNFRTKFLINDAAVLARRPAVFASVYQYEGQMQVYEPAADACVPALPVARCDRGRRRRQLRRGRRARPGARNVRLPAGAAHAEDPAGHAGPARRRAAADGFHELRQHPAQGAAARGMRRARLCPDPRSARRGPGHRNQAVLARRRGTALRAHRCPNRRRVRGEADARAPHAAGRAARGLERLGARGELSVAVCIRQAQPGRRAGAAQAGFRRAFPGRRPAGARGVA